MCYFFDFFKDQLFSVIVYCLYIRKKNFSNGMLPLIQRLITLTFQSNPIKNCFPRVPSGKDLKRNGWMELFSTWILKLLKLRYGFFQDFQGFQSTSIFNQQNLQVMTFQKSDTYDLWTECFYCPPYRLSSGQILFEKLPKNGH